MCEKCLYLTFIWSAFSRIQTQDWEIRNISPYSVQMRENTDQKISRYGHFLRSATYACQEDFEELQNIAQNIIVIEIYRCAIFTIIELYSRIFIQPITLKVDVGCCNLYFNPISVPCIAESCINIKMFMKT